jgi:hypothetical protein
MAERRRTERRIRDAGFFLIERRDRGSVWKYGSIVLAVVLLGVAGWLNLH